MHEPHPPDRARSLGSEQHRCLSGPARTGAARDQDAGQCGRLRRVRPLCRGGPQEAARQRTAQFARAHWHVPREPAVYARRQQHHQHGLKLRLAAGAVSGGVRREQELCPEPVARDRPRAAPAGHPCHVRLPRLDQDRVPAGRAP